MDSRIGSKTIVKRNYAHKEWPMSSHRTRTSKAIDPSNQAILLCDHAWNTRASAIKQCMEIYLHETHHDEQAKSITNLHARVSSSLPEDDHRAQHEPKRPLVSLGAKDISFSLWKGMVRIPRPAPPTRSSGSGSVRSGWHDWDLFWPFRALQIPRIMDNSLFLFPRIKRINHLVPYQSYRSTVTIIHLQPLRSPYKDGR